MNIQNQLQLMARYNQWMNEKLYASCALLSDEQRKQDMGAFFGSIHNTLNHIMFGDHAWMARFRQQKAPYSLGEEIHADFEQLRHERVQLDAQIIDWAQKLSTSWLNSDILYTSRIDSKTRSIAAWVLVTHMFNHQTHHRGQLTTLLSQLDQDYGTTDIPWMPEFNNF